MCVNVWLALPPPIPFLSHKRSVMRKTCFASENKQNTAFQQLCLALMSVFFFPPFPLSGSAIVMGPLHRLSSGNLEHWLDSVSTFFPLTCAGRRKTRHGSGGKEDKSGRCGQELGDGVEGEDDVFRVADLEHVFPSIASWPEGTVFISQWSKFTRKVGYPKSGYQVDVPSTCALCL